MLGAPVSSLTALQLRPILKNLIDCMSSRRFALVQTAASDGGGTQQVAAKAKNTIDGQLNFPDPQHGPKPQVLVQQFQQKVDVSASNPPACLS